MHKDIGVSFIVGDASLVEFICNFVADDLTEFAMAITPELTGPEASKDFEFESLCQQLGQALGT
jgi:hypothetical protein